MMTSLNSNNFKTKLFQDFDKSFTFKTRQIAHTSTVTL